MAVDEDGLLARHERAWAQRVEVLERWNEAWARVEKAGRALDILGRACEAELVRVSHGLSARQREWAAQHATYESRPRDRAGRQVVVKWTYRREQIDAAEIKWAATLTTARQALLETDLSLAAASRQVLDAWGIQAQHLTGVRCSELRILGRRSPTSDSVPCRSESLG